MSGDEPRWDTVEEFKVGRVSARIEQSHADPTDYRLRFSGSQTMLELTRQIDAIGLCDIDDFVKAVQAARDMIAVHRDELSVIECCRRHRLIGVKPFEQKEDR